MNRSRKHYVLPDDMRPLHCAYSMQFTTVAEMEAFIYQGFSFHVDGDRQQAILTSPRADEDVYVH